MNNTLKDLTMKMKKEDLSNNVMILLEIINEQDQKIDKAIEYIEHTELYEVAYDDEGNYFNTFDDKATADLLQILGDKE